MSLPPYVVLTPDWPAPANVHAYSTTRQGGVSETPFTALNLGDHVGDNPRAVLRNRVLMREALRLPEEPVWLSQTHSNRVIEAGVACDLQADGAWTARSGKVCVVMTADCLPVLLCDRAGSRVAALHAGWRGLAEGILEVGIKALGVPGDALMAWLGPAIGPQAFEVGDEVRAVFVARDAGATAAFRANRAGHWLADLYALARMRLAACGVTDIYGGERCTFSEQEWFYSYRRDRVTGRSATLIWLE